MSLSQYRRAIWTLVLSSACLAVGSATAVAADPLPHVLLILVDDLGFGDPGCYNLDSKMETPHIDSLARDGMRFTDAHAAGPLCHVSRYGLLTGRYPFRADVGSWPRRGVIDADQTTIATMLKDKGYRTAMVGKWHLGFDEREYDQPWRGGPVDVGFDSFFGIRASTDIPPYFYIRDDRAVAAPTVPIAANHSDGWSPIQGAFWRKGLIADDLDLADVLPRFTTEAIEVIDQHAQAHKSNDRPMPLMLYLALPAPHTPWLPAKKFVGKSKAGMYGDFVEMVDAEIGRVLAALEDSGMAEQTLVLFTSDNGPVWYDADVERFGHDSAGGLRGMKGDAWEAGHRMPFLVRWPARVAAGSVSSQLICFTDLQATLANLVDYPLEENDAPDSFDFSGELVGQQPAHRLVRKALVMRSAAGLMTVREGDWKLIAGLGSGGFSRPGKIDPKAGQPAGQLYNLATDPAETTNRYSQRPDKVLRLHQILNSVCETNRSR